MSPSTNPKTRRTAGSTVRRLGIGVALSTAGIIMTGCVAQAASARPIEGLQKGYSPDRIACNTSLPLGECFVETNDHETVAEAVAVVIFDPSNPV